MLLVQWNLESPSTLGWGRYLNAEDTWMSQIGGLHVKDKWTCHTKPKSPAPHQNTQADVHLSASKYTPTGSSKCITCKMSS